jgi:hypothetical protein
MPPGMSCYIYDERERRGNFISYRSYSPQLRIVPQLPMDVPRYVHTYWMTLQDLIPDNSYIPRLYIKLHSTLGFVSRNAAFPRSARHSARTMWGKTAYCTPTNKRTSYLVLCAPGDRIISIAEVSHRDSCYPGCWLSMSLGCDGSIKLGNLPLQRGTVRSIFHEDLDDLRNVDAVLTCPHPGVRDRPSAIL